MDEFERAMELAAVGDDRDAAYAALTLVAQTAGIWQDTWRAKSIAEVGEMIAAHLASMTPDAPLLALAEKWRKEASAARVSGRPLGIAGMAERHAEELTKAITHRGGSDD
jgi:hypothetical protein